MKCFPTAVGGLLLVLPLSAGMVYAQSTPTHSTTKAATPSTQTQAPGAPTAAATSPKDPNAPTPPAHPITTEQTRELLDLMAYKKMEDGSWSQMIAMNKQAAPFIPQDVWTDVQSGIAGIDYVAMMQPIYAKYLSTEDAAKALEFYRTPAGRHVLQSMPPILGESVAASQQKGRQVGRDAIEKHRPEIEAAQKKYQAEHAPAEQGPTLGPGAPPSGSTAPSSAAPRSSTPGTPAPANQAPATPPQPKR